MTRHSPAELCLDGDAFERPVLAPTVRLVGKMPGVGFEQDQWLLEREGSFIQTTDLIYRIAQQCDGSNTLPEIAQKVTDSSDWTLDADDVRQILALKLGPLRLVRTATSEDGDAVGNAVEHRPSVLGVNIRMGLLRPSVVNRVTRVLQYLYAPLVVLGVAVPVAYAHWWLYHVHGISRAFQDLLYTPGGLLSVFCIVFAAAAFHEFGHASALARYGGSVRGMGVGLYLLYPAFYTDVTDSYRLTRQGRIATDLGGVYFHLMFALAVFGAYFLTGKEFLLIAVCLIDLEIIRQFVPVVRLDGYWLFADLTGIPDPFSVMGPFLLSLLPASMNVKRESFPALKTWVKAVFLLYVIGTVPLLTYAFVRMVVELPNAISDTWKSWQLQTHTLVVLRGSDPAASLLVLTQIFFLALPVVGTIYLIVILVRGPVVTFSTWISQNRRNALQGAAALAGVCLVVAAMASVSPTELLQRLRSWHRSEHVLAHTEEAFGNLRSIRADLEGSLGSDHFTGTVVLERPNRARIEVNGSGGLGDFLVVSDGSKATTYFRKDNTYVQTPAGRNGEHIQAFIAEQVADFFQPAAISRDKKFKYLGRDKVGEIEYDVVQYEAPGSGTVRYLISPADNLIHRVIRFSKAGSGGTTSWASMSNIQKNVQVEPATFEWTLPATARTVELPSGIELPMSK